MLFFTGQFYWLGAFQIYKMLAWFSCISIAGSLYIIQQCSLNVVIHNLLPIARLAYNQLLSGKFNFTGIQQQPYGVDLFFFGTNIG